MKFFRRSVALAATGVVAIAATGIVATNSQAADGDKSYLILEADASGADWIFEGESVRVSPDKDCSVVTGADNDLARLAGIGGPKDVLGFNDNGFGVKSKGPGTNCGYVTGSQAIEITLGPDTRGSGDLRRLITDAEVDVESKFACDISVEYFRGSTRIGTESIKASERSDCGPDSGTSDNVRAELSVPGPGADKIVLRAGGDGAISVEGGVESEALPGGLITEAELATTGSVFELTEGAGVIPEDGRVVIRDPSGAVATIENALSSDGLDIPYLTEPCVDAEPCVNFKLIPDEGDPEFYRLTAYVSVPVNDEGYQTFWDGEIDFDGNGGNSFILGQLSTGTPDSSCVIDESVLKGQACITDFRYPDPQDGTVNPELSSASSTTYRTDIWDLWVNDPNIR